MKNHLEYVEIKNFKSVKDLRLDCGRINVFVGKPNVGKSNILEAIGLLGAENSYSNKFCEGIARYETLNNLFYDSVIIDQEISVSTNLKSCFLKYFHQVNKFG